MEAWLARAWESLELVGLMGGPPITDTAKIALVMMRVAIDSPVSVWFSALHFAALERSDLRVFKAAFTKRFASLDTLERNLARLETIKMGDFNNDISLFYNAFSLLATRIGQHRSESDLRRNFLHGLHPDLGPALAMLLPPSTQLNKEWPLERVFGQAKHCWEQLTAGVVGTARKTDSSSQRAPAVLAVAAGQCWECGATDHNKAMCPRFTCRRCGLQGHRASECNSGSGSQRGRQSDTRGGGYREYDGRRHQPDGHGGYGRERGSESTSRHNPRAPDGTRGGDTGHIPHWGKVVAPAGTAAPF